MNEFETLGRWWLPRRPDKKIIGTLRFDPLAGAELDLDGVFPDLDSDSPQQEIILGDTRAGKVTLAKCFWTQIIPASKSTYRANIVYVGSHFERDDDIKFQSITFNYSHLGQWIDPDWSERILFHKEEVHSDGPGDVDIDGLRISFNNATEIKGISSREVVVKHIASVDIIPPSDSNLEEYKRISFLLEAFLSLAMGRGIFPLSMQGYAKESDRGGDGTAILQTRVSKLDLSDIYPHQMSFSFRDISDCFHNYLGNWFQKGKDLRISLQLYMSLFYNPSLPLETRFLNLFQALESYHRRFYDGQYLTKEYYDQKIYHGLVESIPSEIDDALQSRIKNGMKYFYEFSLRKRMRDIYEKLHKPVSLFIADGETDRFVDVRNAYVHYDPKNDTKTPDKLALYIYVQKLRMLLEVCFLTEAGFSTQRIEGFMRRSRKLKEILYLQSR